MRCQGFRASVSVVEIAVFVLVLIKGRGKKCAVRVGAEKIFTSLNCCEALVSHVDTTAL